jgi:AcrR family transcriptional regulator
VPTTRDRIITATGELFRRQGYNGTSLKQVIAAADAPFGSLYHAFPGGKEQLAEEVILTSGQAYQELFEVIADAASDPAAAITDLFDGAAAVLEETDHIDACPIGTVALEVASTNDRLRRATAAVFAGWVEAAAGRLAAAGVPRAGAEELATTMVAAIEGGFMLSRAARSPEPMRAAGRLMRRLVESALASAGTPRPARSARS